MPVSVFRCPMCRDALPGWPPDLTCRSCGNTTAEADGVACFRAASDGATASAQSVDYDAVASTYATHLHPPSLASRLAAAYGQEIARQAGGGGLVLDLGCGPGHYAIESARAGCRVIAGDISRNMLHILVRNLPESVRDRIVPCELDAQNLPINDGAVDAVVALAVLHFVGDPWRVMREVTRVLSPEGLFITSGPVDKVTKGEDLAATARNVYGQALREQGVVEGKLPGWHTRDIAANLPRFFAGHKTVESDDLRFRYSQSVGFVLRRLEGRYTAFQISIPERAHTAALRQVRDVFRTRYGDGYESIEQSCTAVHRLSVYSSHPGNPATVTP